MTAFCVYARRVRFGKYELTPLGAAVLGGDGR